VLTTGCIQSNVIRPVLVITVRLSNKSRKLAGNFSSLVPALMQQKKPPHSAFLPIMQRIPHQLQQALQSFTKLWNRPSITSELRNIL